MHVSIFLPVNASVPFLRTKKKQRQERTAAVAAVRGTSTMKLPRWQKKKTRTEEKKKNEKKRANYTTENEMTFPGGYISAAPTPLGGRVGVGSI